jgi:hypothetical protein
MSRSNGTISATYATQKAKKIAQFQACADGMDSADLQGVDVITLNGVDWKKADLKAKFLGVVTAAKATLAAHQDLSTCVATEKDVEVEATPLRNGIRGYLKTRFGKKSPKLQTWGFAPDQQPAKSPQVKADAVQKAKETRAMRGTNKGRKQKAQITGTAPEVPAATTQAAAASPAPKAGGGNGGGPSA